MADQIAIAALTRKRAELSGEIIRAQKDIARLKCEIAALDTTIRIFDPSQVPFRIRPVVKVKHRVIPKLRHGEFGRMVLTLLRGADDPLSVGEIVERLSARAISRSMRVPNDPVDPDGIAPDVFVPKSQRDPVTYATRWLERQAD
ncbi:MAG: hypothetical protein QOJ54_1491 [Aliidongia sp.]|jgi:hypothetical protein|nr:hypothetical protein [Aliidongia sp.]